MNRLIASLAAAGSLLASAALAQNIAIVGGTVHTMGPDGVINDGTVLIEDGRIAAVGADVRVPAGVETIDANGRIVTPGLVAALTNLGVVEVSAVSGTRDGSVEDTPFNAAFGVSYGINPDATAIPVTRIEGVTRALVAPGRGDSIFGGLGAAIHLGHGMDIVSHDRLFMMTWLGEAGAREAGGARGGAMVTLLNALKDAERYAAMDDTGDFEGRIVGALDAEALGPVLRGEVKLAVAADRASDLLLLVRLKREMPDLDLVALGAAEGWRVADELAAAGIPVLINPFDNLPGSFASLAATQANAARLVEAGVTVALGAGGDPGGQPRLIPQLAGNAVANGMDRMDALAAITIGPAKAFGIDDVAGSLETGKAGDVVIWDGDPLEVMARPATVVINGERIELVSRQTLLRDRYMELDGPMPPQYRK